MACRVTFSRSLNAPVEIFPKMISLIAFFLIFLVIGLSVLWFYGGEKSEDIKEKLNDMFKSIKSFAKSTKELTLILKDLIQREELVETNLSTETETSESLETVVLESTNVPAKGDLMNQSILFSKS